MTRPKHVDRPKFLIVFVRCQGNNYWRDALVDMARFSPLPRFLMLYGAVFAAFGVASPFLPGLLQQDGLTADTLGLVLAAGTAIRLISGPLGGRIADRLGRPSLVLAAFTAVSALVALAYVPARGVVLLLLVSVGHAAVLAPLTPVADALALGSASGKPGFSYGWVRSAGSAAFIVGTMVSGYFVGGYGLGVIIWLNAGLLAVAACVSLCVPDTVGGRDRQDVSATDDHSAASKAGAWRGLFAISGFARLMMVVALIGGSHAMHDGFEVIRWRNAGLSAAQCSVLWSLSVAAEVVVFCLLGRPILARFGPAKALTVAAVAGVLRWGAAAMTASFTVMALVEPLHGLTFALLHLACMDAMTQMVPKRLANTAQAFYGTIAMGATAAAVTLVSGSMFERFGAGAFWAMAAMCGLAIPLASGRLGMPLAIGEAVRPKG